MLSDQKLSRSRTNENREPDFSLLALGGELIQVGFGMDVSLLLGTALEVSTLLFVLSTKLKVRLSSVPSYSGHKFRKGQLRDRRTRNLFRRFLAVALYEGLLDLIYW